MVALLAGAVWSQDYEVADVQCHLGDAFGRGQRMEARLRRPPTFSGQPVFADDLQTNPRSDPHCRIAAESSADAAGRIYRLVVDDFNRCGVTRHSVSCSFQLNWCQK